jgi:hypothetical protein
VQGQKSAEIVFGNPNDAARPMGNKLTAVDPAPDRAGGNAETFRNLHNRKKFKSNVPLRTTRDIAETDRFTAAEVTRHFPPPYCGRIGRSAPKQDAHSKILIAKLQ